MTTAADTVLLTVTGRDRPGVTSRLCALLAERGVRILDMEQVVVRDRLTLGLLVRVAGGTAALGDRPGAAGVEKVCADLGLDVEAEIVEAEPPRRATPATTHHVTVLGAPLAADALAAVTGAIADVGGNIERITRLSRYPILSFDLEVSGPSGAGLRRAVTAAAAAARVDVAVQPGGLYRRAKRLICFDVDSTIVAGEVIELLAEQAGCAAEVAAITGAAMAGELDFEQALRQRVALLEGCPVGALDHVRDHLVLTPGTRTVLRTLKRLGYTTAIVSGGFTQITDPLAAQLGVEHSRANTLEIVDGRMTGRLVGPVIDRAAKAQALAHFAAASGVPLEQTVAVGDGANDLDMLAAAGLGIAFNAKPIVRAAADTAVSVPYLDAILFVLGITREEVEAADAADPAFEVSEPPAVED